MVLPPAVADIRFSSNERFSINESTLHSWPGCFTAIIAGIAVCWTRMNSSHVSERDHDALIPAQDWDEFRNNVVELIDGMRP